MQPGAGIADLGAGDERRPVAEAGGRGGAAGALGDVLVDLAVLVGTGAEALHRGHDHARIGLVDVLPGEPHAVERAGREILHQHVAMLDQPVEDFLALGMLGVDGDRALVAVEHGEIEAVGALHVAQLAARDVADAGPLDLDAVGAHIGEKLGAGRPRLHMGEIEDAHAVERLAGVAPRLGRGRRQALPRRRLGRRALRGRLCFGRLVLPTACRCRLFGRLLRPASSRPSSMTSCAFLAAVFLAAPSAGFRLLASGHCDSPLLSTISCEPRFAD